MSTIPKLETERLVLRQVSLADIPTVQRLLDDWELARFMSEITWPFPADGGEKYVKEHLERVEKGEEYGWAICLKDAPDDLLGHIKFEIGWNPGEWGRFFWLGRNFQGKGYMTEAVIAATDWVFENVKPEKLMVSNVVGNDASKRIKEKTGARFLRIEDCRKVRDGHTQKEIWELTPKLWHEWKRNT
jgi:RimJ/RimL family protein N-acetyltransferase